MTKKAPKRRNVFRIGRTTQSIAIADLSSLEVKVIEHPVLDRWEKGWYKDELNALGVDVFNQITGLSR
jgi:hypothetical protein